MMRYVLLLLLCLAQSSQADGFLGSLPQLGGTKQEAFLPPDQEFGLEVSVRDGRTLLAAFKVAPGYYLYRDKVSLSIKGASAKSAGIKISGISMPEGEIKHDANFGDTAVFHQPFQAEITLERTGGAAQNFTLEAGYQGCKDKSLCYPPINKSINIALPEAGIAASAKANPATAIAPGVAQQAQTTTRPAPADSENIQIAKLFKQGSFWLIV